MDYSNNQFLKKKDGNIGTKIFSVFLLCLFVIELAVSLAAVILLVGDILKRIF